MSIEDMLADIKRRKWFLTNLYEGADGIWRCFIRAKRNDISWHQRGQGKTAKDALASALKYDPIDAMLE